MAPTSTPTAVLVLILFLATPVLAQNGVTGNLTSSSTNCATAGSCLVLPLANNAIGGAVFTISGTFSATMQFEAAGPDGIFYSLNVTPSNSTSAVTSATAAGIWQANVAGYAVVRIHCSTFVSGTVVVGIQGSTASARPGGGVGSNVPTALNVKTSVTPAAIGDARETPGVTWTGTNATTITGTGTEWTASDVGKLIFCVDSATGGLVVSVGTKISSQGGTTVGLSQATTGSTTGSRCVWYTQDETASFQAASAILNTGTSFGQSVNSGNFYTFPTLGIVYPHTLIFVPCGGYVVSNTVLDGHLGLPGAGMMGEAEGCVVLFLSPSTHFTPVTSLIQIQGPAVQNYFADFSVDGVGYSNSNLNNDQIIYLSCANCYIGNVSITNVSSTSPSSTAMFNLAGGVNNLAENLFAQNNGAIACELQAGGIALVNSLCSNSSINLLVQNATSSSTFLGGKVEIIGGIMDECGSPGPCTQVVNSTGVDFVGTTIWSSVGETALSVDGTSEVQLENATVGPYNKQNNATAVNVASGGTLRASNTHFLSTGTGFCWNLSGTYIDVGGNRCDQVSSGGLLTGSGTVVSTLTHTWNTCNVAGTFGAVTMCNQYLDQQLQLTRIKASSNVSTTCATAPVVTLTNGTVSKTLTLTSGASTWDSGAITSGNVFASGTTLTVSVSAGSCATPPTNLAVTYNMQAYLNNQ